ncbi:hypothetical protein [Microvirga lotononidis]|uniref:Lipoprotein n=1 Tax=Microvirga lotononidis TaxID=864069 RepID=I4YQ00_9HYPH|nr:hypothetical protein [Microvirga lotononidis]EIM26042.1 hypothetical protein MicloDRAFT_00067720 [Microvirga lotononidis]WQO25951.1 hypothetical protein U0023_14670 [Microvirga lotononidis]
MRDGLSRKAGWTLAALGLTALTGCGPSGGGGGFGMGDMLLTAGTRQAPAQSAEIRDVYCPTIDVVDGGAALQVRGGREEGSIRSQVTLGEIARECVGQPDGSTLVKVGVEARALLGVGGSSGRYDVPVHIVVKDGSTVFADRSRRVAAAIPAGQTQTTVSVIEEGIVVPPSYANSFEIQVGLGGGGRAAPGRRRG